ncbi:MAG: plastocyanin/azurin family copper-binding protein [Thermoanaerobaculia bacterium]|nr:plastocyanin/azurin family copper-binding protein [Thermoanaerobaculia bacterium]
MPIRALRVAAVLALALLAGACVLVFDAGLYQAFKLHFALSQLLPEGEGTLVHSLHYPSEVKLKGKWVRVSGALEAPDGQPLPDELAVESRFEDADGKLLFRLRGTAVPDGDGLFSLRLKLRKNIAADTLQMLLVEPRGAALAKDTRIWLCVHVVEKKKHLSGLPDCVGQGGDDPGPAPGTFVVQVLDNSFSPQRVRVQPGDTVRWELAGADFSHTVTAMDASVFDSGFLSTPGAFFEMTFTGAHDDQTFEYFCRTHHTCCAMQGSVQVGNDAPDPGDGY